MSKQPRPDNDNPPVEKPAGPRTPYPVERPGIRQQPGAEPDYIRARPRTFQRCDCMVMDMVTDMDMDMAMEENMEAVIIRKRNWESSRFSKVFSVENKKQKNYIHAKKVYFSFSYVTEE